MGLFPARAFPSARTFASLGSSSQPKSIKRTPAASPASTTTITGDGFLKALVNAFRIYV
jgi:hypothetical protein